MTDRDLITFLGGPAELARKLNYDLKNGGCQRVQNWMTRGIPPRVRLDHFELFQSAMVGMAEKVGAGDTAPEPHQEAA